MRRPTASRGRLCFLRRNLLPGAGSIVGRHLEHAPSPRGKPRPGGRAAARQQRRRSTTFGGLSAWPAGSAAAGGAVGARGGKASLRRAWSWEAPSFGGAGAEPGMSVDVCGPAAEEEGARGYGDERALGAEEFAKVARGRDESEEEEGGEEAGAAGTDDEGEEGGEEAAEQPFGIATGSAEALVEGFRNASEAFRHPHAAAAELAGACACLSLPLSLSLCTSWWQGCVWGRRQAHANWPALWWLLCAVPQGG